MTGPFIVFLVVAAIILRGPLGRAWADRIAGRRPPGMPGADEEVLAELDDLRQRLMQVEERLDFTERMLAQQKARGLQGPAA
jgi:hypothetical protein